MQFRIYHQLETEMKTKLFYTVARTVHQRDNDTLTNTRMSPIFYSETARDAWIKAFRDNCKNEEGAEKPFKGDIIELSFQYREDLMDTDDMDEHCPVYQVTLEIVERKTIEVEIEGETDEDDACEVASENYRMGEYDWMLEDIEPWETDIDDAVADEL